MFPYRFSTVLSGLLLIVSAGCTTTPHERFGSAAGSAAATVTFNQLKEAPAAYRGQVVVLGGEVLSAKRLTSGTRVEVLQLPLEGDREPLVDRTSSEGRFLAFQKEFLDPAKFPAGTRVTITGEVTGSSTEPLDEVPYTYPTLDIKEITTWPDIESSRSRRYYPYYRPYPYGFGSYGWPYGGAGRFGPYPYWW